MLTKQIVIEIGRIVEPYKLIEVKTTTNIIEGGKIISFSNHNHVCTPDHADITDQTQVVQDVASVLWTDEIKENYKSHLENLHTVTMNET